MGGQRGEGTDFLFFLCSHVVLEVPQDVPNSTLNLPCMVCSKFNSHVYKLKRWATWEHIYFYFATWSWKRCFYWEVPNVTKNWWCTNQYGFLKKIKIKFEHIHELINTNHIMSPKEWCMFGHEICDEINICTLKDYHPMCCKTNFLVTSFFVKPPNLTRLPTIIWLILFNVLFLYTILI